MKERKNENVENNFLCITHLNAEYWVKYIK